MIDFSIPLEASQHLYAKAQRTKDAQLGVGVFAKGVFGFHDLDDTRTFSLCLQIFLAKMAANEHRTYREGGFAIEVTESRGRQIRHHATAPQQLDQGQEGAFWMGLWIIGSTKWKQRHKTR